MGTNAMSTILRSLRNLRRVGLRDAAHQMQHIGILDSGDLYCVGNLWNLQVIPRPAHIEPGWHAWISYMVDKPPTEDPILKTGVRAWELPEHRPNFTQTRAAYRPYSTVKPKFNAWTPVVAQRG